MPKSESRYKQIIRKIFFDHYDQGVTEFEFLRSDFDHAAHDLGFDRVSNIGDNIYNFRFGRALLPEEIMATAPKGKGWMIWLAGRGKYRFRLGPYPFFVPGANKTVIHIPDATPGVIDMYALSDEQALLAKLRYNRLIDIFTGVTSYSLQNHLRTTAGRMGQVETDEIYIGVDRRGAHHIFPVQAKGGKDQLSVVQVVQDFEVCQKDEFSMLDPLPIGAQFLQDDVIALLAFQRTGLYDAAVLLEQHYKLVPPDRMTAEEIEAYRHHPMPKLW